MPYIPLSHYLCGPRPHTPLPHPLPHSHALSAPHTCPAPPGLAPVWCHLSQVKFSPDNATILSMASVEGEVVDLTAPVTVGAVPCRGVMWCGVVWCAAVP